ncbi:MAG: WecB/TagA/CpsF family glycosyltransferase [Ignavibacteria bacterium]|nr:WecB/TagA/CpsF family glycosyltransferase [Ignavibacteria bacterium]
MDIRNLTDESFLDYISEGIRNEKKLAIGYANADTLNKIYDDGNLKNIFNTFDLIHPDGVGVYLASRILFGKNGLDRRLTGSDFYPLLISESINKNWSYFFFGHSNEILEEIKVQHPSLNISGMNEGYDFDSAKVIEKINKANPDIIIIGLSCPHQENWIYQNRDKIKFKIILAAGDGIRIFANKKIRGPLIFRKMGFEWVIRLFSDPISNFRKYVIGVPLFIFRIFKSKLKTI